MTTASPIPEVSETAQQHEGAEMETLTPAPFYNENIIENRPELQEEIHHPEGDHAHHKKHGPFDIASTDFWYFVAFVLFVLLLGRPLWRGLKSFLDKRIETIARQLREAKALREEAESLLTNYNRKRRDALTEAEKLIDRTHQEVNRLKQDALNTLEKQLAEREAQTLQKIRSSEAKAIAEVQSAAAGIAIGAVYDLIRQNLSEADQERLMEAELKSLPQDLAA